MTIRSAWHFVASATINSVRSRLPPWPLVHGDHAGGNAFADLGLALDHAAGIKDAHSIASFDLSLGCISWIDKNVDRIKIIHPAVVGTAVQPGNRVGRTNRERILFGQRVPGIFKLVQIGWQRGQPSGFHGFRVKLDFAGLGRERLPAASHHGRVFFGRQSEIPGGKGAHSRRPRSDLEPAQY